MGQPTPTTPARVSEGPPHPRPGPRETGQEAREHIGLSSSSSHTPLPGDETARGVCGLLSCGREGGCGVFSSLGVFVFYFFFVAVCWAGCSLEFFALHACRSGHRGRGPVSGGYRPDSESSEFPRIDPASSVPSPAQAQPRTSVTGVLGEEVSWCCGHGLYVCWCICGIVVCICLFMCLPCM